MLSKVGKILEFFWLFVLVACAQKGPLQNNGLPTTSVQPYPGIDQPNTPYPIQDMTALPTVETARVPTGTPVPYPSPGPTPTNPPEEPIATHAHLTQLEMFDANTGWAVLDVYPENSPQYSQILRISDSIQAWEDVSPPIPEEQSGPLAASFIDANIAIAIYRQQLQPTSFDVEVTTWQTIDGGQTWQPRGILQSDLGIVTGLDVMMIDPEHGWMLGTGAQAMWASSVYFFETRNGGTQWDMAYDYAQHLSDTYTLHIGGYYPFSKHFTFVSETAGFFSNGRLFRTQDGGRNWVFQSLEPPADLPDIGCNSGECKYLDMISVPQFTSTEDGIMIRRAYLNSDEVMTSFTYGDPLKQLPEAQYFYFTHDGGQTWVPRPSPVKIGTVAFLDAHRGWLLGKSDPDPETTTQLHQTTDGGVTWSQVAMDSPLPLGSELQFVDDLNGFAYHPYSASYYYRGLDSRAPTSDQNSPLYKTIDGGRSWEALELQIAP